MGNPTPIQERSVDPYSSYDSNVVNKLTRIISDGTDCLLMPTPVMCSHFSGTVIRASEGKSIKDDVLIETKLLDISITDADFYVDSSNGTNNEDGYYYVVLEYVYNKIAPPPEANIKLIKPSQRAGTYNPTLHLFINCVRIIGGVLAGIWNYDPENPSVERHLVGGGGVGTQVEWTSISDSGSSTLTSDSDTIACHTTTGSQDIYLPIVDLSKKMIRIVKMTSDTNVVNVHRVSPDSIEGKISIVLRKQYDSVSLIPYPIDNVWIEV